MEHPKLKQLDPFLDAEGAERLAHLIASMEPPVREDETPFSDDFNEGFKRALVLAVTLTMAAGGHCD